MKKHKRLAAIFMAMLMMFSNVGFVTQVFGQGETDIVYDATPSYDEGLRVVRDEVAMRSMVEFTIETETEQMRTTTTNFIRRSHPITTIQQGQSTQNTAATVAQMIWTVAGAVFAPVGFLDTGISLWRQVRNLTSPNDHIVTAPSSFLQVGTRFNEIRRRTYAMSAGGTWNLGLTSQQITLTFLESRMHAMVNNVGRNFQTSRNVWGVVSSPNFRDPWSLAHQRAAGLRPLGPLVQSVTGRVANTTFDFRP